MSQPSEFGASQNRALDAGGIQSFATEADRARLTPAAVKGFRSVQERWGLTNAEAAEMIGVSISTWERMVAGSGTNSLSQDQLTRVSTVVGVFKGLHLLFSDSMSDRWPRLPNSGPLFGNLTPVQAMVRGGIPMMLDVRRHVDALRGGL